MSGGDGGEAEISTEKGLTGQHIKVFSTGAAELRIIDPTGNSKLFIAKNQET